MKDKLTTGQWAALITQASPAKLIVINYELLIENLLEAKEYVGDEKAFAKYMEKARAFLMHLIESLNPTIDVGAQLFHAYMYINKLLINASMSRKIEYVDEAIAHTRTLLSAFKIVCEKAEKEDTAPVMQNAEQLYAGLTYGKGNLVETVWTLDKKRGLKA